MPSPDCPTLTWTDTWPSGRKGVIDFAVPANMSGWVLTLTFTEDIKEFNGDEVMLGFDIDFDEQTTNMPPDVISAKLKGKGNASEEYDLCLQAPPPKSTTEPFVPTTQPEVPTTQPEVPTTQPDAPTTQPEVPTTTIINPKDMPVLSVGDDNNNHHQSKRHA